MPGHHWKGAMSTEACASDSDQLRPFRTKADDDECPCDRQARADEITRSWPLLLSDPQPVQRSGNVDPTVGRVCAAANAASTRQQPPGAALPCSGAPRASDGQVRHQHSLRQESPRLIVFVIATAVEGQADRNSTEICTLAGNSDRAIRTNPNLEKNASAVIVSR
jgi:hypothetical protein